MNKFIKNVCSAIAIACGSAVFVGCDYCAYAAQIDIEVLTSEDESSFESAITQKSKLPEANLLVG